jgi:GT2 family glycosyltransferase
MNQFRNTKIPNRDIKVSIIVLNWNGWEDTLKCLDSLRNLYYLDFDIVIVDNGSADESVLRIEEYLQSNVEFFSQNLGQIKFIKNGTNLGYAGGNNLGLKYAMNETNADAFWVLNNDTSVERDALIEMVQKMHKGFDVVGSQIRYGYDHNLIWCECGGVYSSWTMASSNVSANKKIRTSISNFEEHESQIENMVDYIAGASILFSRKALRLVGLFCEDYFLYFEEPDWFNRALLFDLKIGYSSKSIVYHEVGRSTDKYNKTIGKFYAFRQMQLRNTFKFAMKFHKDKLIFIFIFMTFRELWSLLKYILRKFRFYYNEKY